MVMCTQDFFFSCKSEHDKQLCFVAVAKDEEGFDRDMRTLFVAQVARKADERDIFQFFSECGKVRSVVCTRAV